MLSGRPLQHIDLFSDAGRLEGLYRSLESPVAAAVICHPHPVHGGTLHNKVVFRATKGLESADVATLRFNFRGAGRSQGRHDGGRGEMLDFEAALRWVQQQHPDLPVLVGGFSFGSWVASRAALDHYDAIRGLFLIGAPVAKYDLDYLRQWEKPTLIIQGSEDEFGSSDTLAPIVERMRHAEMIVVTGADHFFRNDLDAVEATIGDWARRVLEG